MNTADSGSIQNTPSSTTSPPSTGTQRFRHRTRRSREHAGMTVETAFLFLTAMHSSDEATIAATRTRMSAFIPSAS